MTPVDAIEFRHVMGHFPTGVAVVTTSHEGNRHGMTANSVTSVSLDPVMLLVCFSREARTALAVQQAGRFAVNILREDQEEISHRFARPLQDHFEGLAVGEGPGGLPLLPGCLAYLACAVEEIVPAGDHDIVLGTVEHCQVDPNGGTPLVFFRGGYQRLPGPSRLG
ncbi:MAG: flavin reductase family protein [Actinomycetota bacterium]|nr:flavin reductase family protein [Actinomycetota bacterium]